MMFFNFLLVTSIKVIVYVLLAMFIWDVLVRRFLIEKIFSLILVFVYLAYALLLAGLEFLSFVILLLYVGAIAVLFLFVVMILNPDYALVLEEQKQLQMEYYNQKEEEETRNQVQEMTWGEWVQSLAISFLIGNIFTLIFVTKVVFPMLRKPNSDTLNQGSNEFFNTNALSYIYNLKNQSLFIYKKDMQLAEVGDVLYNKYGMGVIIIGGALVVAMIGSIMLCTYQTFKLKRQNISKQSKRYKA